MDSGIRTELPVHINQNDNLDIKTLLTIEKLLLHLEAKGRSKKTRDGIRKHLKQLIRQPNPFNPKVKVNMDNTEEVELAIARYIKKDGKPASNIYKIKLCDCYAAYCKFKKIMWERPEYTPEERAVQPPTDEKCQMLIASARGELSIKIAVSTETGL